MVSRFTAKSSRQTQVWRYTNKVRLRGLKIEKKLRANPVFKNYFIESAQADFVCVVATYSRPELELMLVFFIKFIAIPPEG